MKKVAIVDLFSEYYFFCYILFKIVANILRIPLYLVMRPQYFLGRFSVQIKQSVDLIINLEKEYQRKIKAIDFVDLQNLLGGEDPNLFLKFGNKYGNVNFIEALSIAYIAKVTHPKKVFEIGTFDGFSTYHLSMNSDPDTKIYTLNLPLEVDNTKQHHKKISLLDYHDDNHTHSGLKKIGVLYENSPAANRVSQLLGDSLVFDFSPFRGSMDLVFIDGGHSLECVSSDTKNAFNMLSNKGLIIWHDFNVQHRDIYNFLMKLSKDRKIFWLAGTRLAIYSKYLKES